MPEDLKERVIGYYEYMWQRKKGVSTEGIYKDLPVTFQAEVSHAINSSTLQTVSPVLTTVMTDLSTMFEGTHSRVQLKSVVKSNVSSFRLK